MCKFVLCQRHLPPKETVSKSHLGAKDEGLGVDEDQRFPFHHTSSVSNTGAQASEPYQLESESLRHQGKTDNKDLFSLLIKTSSE